MSEWDFLYEMKDPGYSEAEIQDAMASGVARWEWAYIEKQERKAEWEKLKVSAQPHHLKIPYTHEYP